MGAESLVEESALQQRPHPQRAEAGLANTRDGVLAACRAYVKQAAQDFVGERRSRFRCLLAVDPNLLDLPLRLAEQWSGRRHRAVASAIGQVETCAQVSGCLAGREHIGRL
jgi:hypothetical protein